MKPKVLVEKLRHGPGLPDQIRRAVFHLSLDRDFNGARAVFIKPNLTYPAYKEGVTTRIEFIEALVTCLREINSSTRIYIGEGEGGIQQLLND